MGMDEQYEQMRRFSAQLETYDAALRAGLNDLQQAHDHVSPIWNDAFRRRYDAIWEPFHKQMEDYVSNGAPRYEAYLRKKIVHLSRFLFGNDSV